MNTETIGLSPDDAAPNETHEIAPRVRYEVPEIVKMAWKIKQERRDYAAGRVHPGFH